MDSHIQMPRVVLKEFVNDRHSYYKYCVLNNEITIGVPKKSSILQHTIYTVTPKHINAQSGTLENRINVAP